MATVANSPTPPQFVQKRPILRKKIWERMNEKDKNYMAAICGQTGSGKSLFAVRLAEIVDPEFSAEQVVFRIEDFMELVADRSYGPGSMIVFDEVGVALSAATHYDPDQIEIQHVLETWREQNRGLLMTVPHLHLIQKSSRGLLHAQMDMLGINREWLMSTARYRFIQQNTDTGDLYKKYPVLQDLKGGGRKKYRKVSLFKPSPQLLDEYLDKKIEFNNQLNQDVLDELIPDDPDGPREPSEIAEDIAENQDISNYVSIHGGNKTRFIDWKLIAAEYAHLGRNRAKQVKSVLENRHGVTVDA